MTEYKIIDKPVLTKSPWTGKNQYMIRTISVKNRIYNYFCETEQLAIDLYNKKLKQLIK